MADAIPGPTTNRERRAMLPVLQEKRAEIMKEFRNVHEQIQRLKVEIASAGDDGSE